MGIFTFCQSDKDECELNTVEVAQRWQMTKEKAIYSAAYTDLNSWSKQKL